MPCLFLFRLNFGCTRTTPITIALQLYLISGFIHGSATAHTLEFVE